MSHIIYVCYQASPTIWRQSEATLCLTFYYPNVIFCWAFTLCVLHQTFLQLLLVTEVILKDLLDALNNTPFNSWVCFYKPFMARALAGSRPVFIQRQRLRSEQSGAQAKIVQCKLNCGIPDGGWVPVWTIRVCKYQSRTDRSHCFSSPLLSFLSRFFSTFCSSLHLCHFIVIHCCHVRGPPVLTAAFISCHLFPPQLLPVVFLSFVRLWFNFLIYFRSPHFLPAHFCPSFSFLFHSHSSFSSFPLSLTGDPETLPKWNVVSLCFYRPHFPASPRCYSSSCFY